MLLTNVQRTSADSHMFPLFGESNAIQALVVDPNGRRQTNNLVSRVTGNHLRLTLILFKSKLLQTTCLDRTATTYDSLLRFHLIKFWTMLSTMRMTMTMMMTVTMTMVMMLRMRMQESRVEEGSSQASSGPRGKLGFSSHSLDQPLICSLQSRIQNQSLQTNP